MLTRRVVIATAGIVASVMIAHSVEAAPPGLPPVMAVNKTVVAGKQSTLGSFFSIYPNCTSTGTVDVKIIKQPEHGAAQITSGPTFPNFPKDNVRSACNDRQIIAPLITYKSEENYTGDDKLSVRSIDSLGFEHVYFFSIAIKN